MRNIKALVLWSAAQLTVFLASLTYAATKYLLKWGATCTAKWLVVTDNLTCLEEMKDDF
jgi:hypothetical protein